MPTDKTHTIEIADYAPEWPLIFADLKHVIETALGYHVLSIEHVGSTSVPGLAAKPIIDLDVVIESEAIVPNVIEELSELGYRHAGDLGVPGREAFGRSGHDVPYDGTGRTWLSHHLYVCPQQGEELARHLAFRDCLRDNPADALECEGLKRRLARRFRHDIESYIEGKSPFVERILTQHRQWQRTRPSRG